MSLFILHRLGLLLNCVPGGAGVSLVHVYIFYTSVELMSVFKMRQVYILFLQFDIMPFLTLHQVAFSAIH